MLRIQAEALTYDDVSLVPAHSTVLPRDVSLATRFTRDLRLNLPIVSAAMDTVTEARLAIAMAQLGGIGIVHKSMSVERQAAEVARVKNFEAGVIKEPFTVGPETTIGEVLKLTRARNISGVPVVDGDGHLVGIVTGRDMRFEKKLDDPVRHIMTKRDKLVTVKEGASDDEDRPAAPTAVLDRHGQGNGDDQRWEADRQCSDRQDGEDQELEDVEVGFGWPALRGPIHGAERGRAKAARSTVPPSVDSVISRPSGVAQATTVPSAVSRSSSARHRHTTSAARAGLASTRCWRKGSPRSRSNRATASTSTAK